MWHQTKCQQVSFCHKWEDFWDYSWESASYLLLSWFIGSQFDFIEMHRDSKKMDIIFPNLILCWIEKVQFTQIYILTQIEIKDSLICLEVSKPCVERLVFLACVKSKLKQSFSFIEVYIIAKRPTICHCLFYYDEHVKYIFQRIPHFDGIFTIIGILHILLIVMF